MKALSEKDGDYYSKYANELYSKKEILDFIDKCPYDQNSLILSLFFECIHGDTKHNNIRYLELENIKLNKGILKLKDREVSLPKYLLDIISNRPIEDDKEMFSNANGLSIKKVFDPK